MSTISIETKFNGINILVRDSKKESQSSLNNELFPFYNDDFFVSRKMKDSISLIFYENDNEIGITSFAVRNNEICYFLSFGILPQYRNMGIGSHILLLLEEYIVKYFEIRTFGLHVMETSLNALKFYKKNKYSVKHKVKNYYPSKFASAAIYMEKVYL